LGRLYLSGQGVTQDFVKAYHFLTKAASRGDADAQANLAVILANGLGLAANRSEALKWLILASKGYSASHEQIVKMRIDLEKISTQEDINFAQNSVANWIREK